jgi:short-subunit dehydrogenase
MSFTNRVAIITGASSGIGRALAVALAAQGARVGVTARRSDFLESLVQEIRTKGGTIEAAPADVEDRQALLAAVHDLAAKLGPVDLMIANAGVGFHTGANPMNVPGVEQMTRVNFLGTVYAFESVLPEMLKRGSGHIVAIASLAAYKGLPGAAAYCATKAAVKNYCEALRVELYGKGVAVTCVCPGFIDTPMTVNNPKPMPFLMTADEGARRILRALERKPAVFDFPKPMKFLMWLSRWAPDRMIAKRVPITAAPGPEASDTESH